MSAEKTIEDRPLEPSSAPTPVWWLVLKRELTELWVGGRVLNLLILFSILMSITAFLLATNNELSLLPLKQGVLVALTSAITFGLFNGLIVAAESVSGERERATLEAMLLTPINRQQIILGKFLAAISPWPVAFLLSIPYITVLSKGDQVLGSALLLGAVTGTVLAVAFTAFGMLMSIWSNSSRISLFICLLVYIMALVPAQLPGEFQTTVAGAIIAATNPLEATRQFLEKTLMEDLPLSDVIVYLVSPIVVTLIVLAILFLYTAPRLRLEAGRTNIVPSFWRRTEASE